MKKYLLIFYFIFSGCTVTYETPRGCHLMQQGEPCLVDHSCCSIHDHNYNHHPEWRWWRNNHTNNKTIIIQNKPNKPNKPNRPNRPNRTPIKKHRK